MNYLQGPEAERKLAKCLESLGYEESPNLTDGTYATQVPYTGVFGESTTMDLVFRPKSGELVWVSSKYQKVSGSCDEKFYLAAHQFAKTENIKNAIFVLSGPYFDPFYDVEWQSPDKKKGYPGRWKHKTQATYDRAAKRVCFLREFLEEQSVDGMRFYFSFQRNFETTVIENFSCGRNL